MAAKAATEMQALLASAPKGQSEMVEGARELGLPEEDYSAAIAAGKMLNHLMDTDHNECGLNMSIYDAALIMPQICRSAGWPRALSNICSRTFMFLFLNFFMQIFILYMLATEEEVMDKFGGQMNLCNFGASVQDCPGGPNCVGPSGTNFENAGRMYSYQDWALRTFVRDSMKVIFPHKADEIHDMIDPGEYGVENYWIRPVCVFIFMMSVMADLRSTLDMSYILYYVPAKDEPWMAYEVPTWASKAEVKSVKEHGELDFVKFRIAGMSKMWKIINVLVLIVPKIFIWKKTAKYGVMFLMETAGIEDVIVNVTALTFILNLDEMLFDAFSHKAVHHILGQLEPFSVEDHGYRETYTLRETYETVVKDRQRPLLSGALIPWRLVQTLLFTAVFVGEYYWEKCEFSATGGLVSKPMSLPETSVLNLAKFVFPFVPEAAQETPYWTMPQ